MPERSPSGGNAATLPERLAACSECGRPFPEPVPMEQARDDWGDAADDEIAYACGVCADREGWS